MDINGVNNGVNGAKTQSGQQAATTSRAPAPLDVIRQQAMAPRRDTVALSSEAQAITRLQRQLDPTPPINREKVEQLKAAIARGEYHIDAKKVAEKLMAGDDLFA
jgi:negative regulator of flagellin synthesis FlgM